MKKSVSIVLLVACIVVLLIVPLLRLSSGDSYVGEEPFLFLRLAEDPGLYDDLSYSGRSAAYAWGLPLVMSLAPSIMVYLLPFILGLASFILFWLILKKLKVNPDIELLSLILFLLSPCFIYLFSFANSLFFALFLCLLAFYLFLRKSWLSVFIILILPLFSVVLCASVLVLLFFYSYLDDKKSGNLFTTLLIVGILSSVLFYGYFLFSAGIPEAFGDFNFDPFSKFIYDLGSEFGVGIFLCALAFIGMLKKWGDKYKSKFFFLGLIFLVIFSYLKSDALVLLNLFLVVLGAEGLHHVRKVKKWSSTNIKNFVTIIIICGLIFSFIAQFDSLVSEGPDKETVDALEFLETKEQGIVFSDYTRGVLINSAGHKNVMDSNYKFAPDVNERYLESNAFFNTRKAENATEFIEKYDVDYIWVDSEMKDQIWDYDTQGLLFLLEYTNQFNKIYNKGGVEIWEIVEE